MKIYVGKNKKKLKEISLKQLLMRALIEAKGFKEGSEFCNDNLGDNSASWVSTRQFNEKGAVDVNIGFDPENDNKILDLNIWFSEFILDDDNMKKII